MKGELELAAAGRKRIPVPYTGSVPAGTRVPSPHNGFGITSIALYKPQAKRARVNRTPVFRGTRMTTMKGGRPA